MQPPSAGVTEGRAIRASARRRVVVMEGRGWGAAVSRPAFFHAPARAAGMQAGIGVPPDDP